MFDNIDQISRFWTSRRIVSASFWIGGRPVARIVAGLVFAVAYLGFAGGPRLAAQPVEGPALRASGSELRAALQKGAYDRVERLANQYDSPGALLARAHLAELEGELDAAIRFARAARQNTGDRQVERAAVVAVARLERARGNWGEAEEVLRSRLRDDSNAHAVRTELGELLIDQGKRGQAEPLLDTLSRDFNAGRLDGPVALSSLGRAMQLLGSYKDANHAFSLAFDEKKGTTVPHPPGRVAWGELFLSKYNTADAERTFDEVLEVHPRHPGALVGKARVVLETENYYEEARKYLDRAEEVYPASPEVAITRAELAIHDGDWQRAETLASDVLEHRPKRLDAMAVKAAARYLQDDRAGYREVKSSVLSLNPSYAEVLTKTAEFAVRAHRYRDSVDLYREAVEVDSRDASARVGLGIALSRVGRIDEAKQQLGAATRGDPYHVRAHNMLTFFEEVWPEYETRRHEGFLLRAHGQHADALDTLVAPVVDRAIDVYRRKYGFDIEEELSVEIYRKPESFGARTVGLPRINPHGLTFGEVVASRSPREGNFNWRQVVWHEMAHVFHIQESEYRVPRWFTEGLAEYETNVENAHWYRQREPSIAAALQNDDLPSIVELDREFSQARSYADILRAYHLSSLVIHFVVDEWGFEKVGSMVEGFGDYGGTEEVLREVLGVSVEDFDRRLREWLEARLSHFDDQLMVDLRSIPREEELETQFGGDPETGWERAQLAVAKIRSGDASAAEREIRRAVESDGDDPRVRYVATVVSAKRGRMRTAYDHGIAALEAGGDGYKLRLQLGRIARSLERREAARVHLTAASQLYPDGARAWKQQLELAKSAGDTALERRANRRLFELQQTSPVAAERYTEAARERGAWDEAWTGVERWYDIAPLEPEVHRTRIEIALKRGHPEPALASWRVLGALRPDSRAEIYREGVRRLKEAGHEDLADRLAESAREAGGGLEPASVN